LIVIDSVRALIAELSRDRGARLASRFEAELSLACGERVTFLSFVKGK